ncbi:HAD family hydrolase [Nocardia cyriacigeorgica]|uniref:HAD family hydrolase n=1 Tax=Nocardia cyriacigeorgica TaxID=135487 RepID=UPI00189608F6|nr:HAD family phosphatase [Nocardia cyriacigeorgica]MBF6451891.1 HAD family phosphatase [Nocardia cyriacigeorgica]MBF6479001.1 HAD family phosphatase [Nocardia cyriacigeorgica]MBF6549060.1 HAD family phosphatase [Nocardia cyriacigeorgica]
MTIEPLHQTAELDAVIFDYNGVIGLQPTPAMWGELAELADRADDLARFQSAFWDAREPYDSGTLDDADFWTAVLGHRPDPVRLARLRAVDAAMWTHTDNRVVELLHRIERAGLPMVLLSNAPHPVSEALDAADWRTAMADALYSCRLGMNKPHPDTYRKALAATGAADPGAVLFIDDRADNCAAAAQVGLRTLHYTGSPTQLEDRIRAVIATV